MSLTPASETWKPITLLHPESVETLLTVAEHSPPNGCFVEIGVYKGGSAYALSLMAGKQRRALFLYDTFEGMPYADPGDSHAVGEFADTSYEAVCALIPSATVVKGVFPASRVPMPPIAFAHVDVDQYRAVRDCCRELPPLMADGGWILFDDYNCIRAATRAVDEAFPGQVRLTPQRKGLVMIRKEKFRGVA